MGSSALSRQSIYNILNEKTGARKERAERSSLLDPFKEFIDAKFTDFDVPATSLFQDIRRQGYAGGLTTVGVHPL